MSSKSAISLFLVALLAWTSASLAQEGVTFELEDNGTIPAWVVNGPFDLGTFGFGEPRDFDPIGEEAIRPTAGESLVSPLVQGGQVAWEEASVDAGGYLDFLDVVAWGLPSDAPEQIWKARAAYAFTYLDSDRAQSVTLRTGSNSGLKVVLNGDPVFYNPASRNAVAETDSIRLDLREGRNALLIKVMQTHANEAPDFFGSLRWQWGFFARLAGDEDVSGIRVIVPSEPTQTKFTLESTFYFAGSEDSLLQRFDLVVDSPSPEPSDGRVTIRYGEEAEEATITGVRFGVTRHPIWLPAVSDSVEATVGLTLGASAQVSRAWLAPQPRYEIHLAMMSHTDIGYTNIQPVVKERHLRTLDDVIARCEADSTFRWTIETVWQLEQYELGRPKGRFEQLIDLIRSGRIGISPIYSNPYTGWVSNEEFYRAFDAMERYRAEYGISTSSAVYNDTPGMSWIVPQALSSHRVDFLATGINEVYGGYALQQALPKVFQWEGPGGGRVLTYRNEAYNEGQSLGLEKGLSATEYKLWERLHRLRAQGSDYDLVLAIHTFADNGPIPLNAGPNALLWNTKYAYPRFVISTIERFGEAFAARYGDDVPVLRGDWTSSWDVLYQGEASRMVRERWSQNNLPSAEKAATIAWMLDPKHEPLSDRVDKAYRSLLHFSGHGSGLEYGYSSPRDNILAMDYREDYVETARLETVEVLERALYKLSVPEESFEGEGLFLFNPLNWARDAAVEFEFTREHPHAYRMLDMETGDELPASFSGYTLRVVVEDIPPLGYKKIRLVRGDPSADPATDLVKDGCSIENGFYRIEADCLTGIRRIVSKTSGDVLTDGLFATPVWADSLFSMGFEAVTGAPLPVEVIDERPARLVLRTIRDGGLFRATDVSLWTDLDYIDVRQTVDLEQLPETVIVQDYSLAFSFNVPDAEPRVDLAGGFLDPDKDKLPGIEHDAFGVRRGISLTDGDRSVAWVSVDARVARVRVDDAGRPVIYANLTNNFPEDWNRWERKEGSLEFRFAVRERAGGFDSNVAARFGWEQSVPVAGRYTWLRSATPEKSYLTVDGENVVLLSLRPRESKVELRLMNTSVDEPATAVIGSEVVSIDGVTVDLGPGEIRTVTLGFSR
ncbi:MAG TPA: hypothetical protein VMO47_07805 [Rhodothermales bacterium]|nr:hypothetical protein [Rhodothermales bacterium]